MKKPPPRPIRLFPARPGVPTWKDTADMQRKLLQMAMRIPSVDFQPTEVFYRGGQHLYSVDLVRRRGDRIDVVSLQQAIPTLVAVLLLNSYADAEKVDHLYAFGATASMLFPRPDDMDWEDDCDESQKGLLFSDFVSGAQFSFIYDCGNWYRLDSYDDAVNAPTKGTKITRKLLIDEGVPEKVFALLDETKGRIPNNFIYHLLDPYYLVSHFGLDDYDDCDDY